MMEYHKFMQEYLDLGHMVPYYGKEEGYYMPHHAVVKEQSTTTKVRVVFDASAKTSNTKSLNDNMMIGGVLQNKLSSILLRWRTHKYVFTADVEKMYRQILVANEHQKYQRILWRFDKTKPVQEYQLTTVTYGTASAPFLAIRTMQKLAEDEAKNYPAAAALLKKDFYVDDLMSGSDSAESAQKTISEIIEIFQKGKMVIRKWATNCPEVLEKVPENLKLSSLVELNKEETLKTLGILWNPASDNFMFKVKMDKSMKYTKRNLLSSIAKIFDPLGWLAPATVTTKLLIQTLWENGYQWDEVLPPEITKKWLTLEKEFPLLEEIKIPRCIHSDNKNMELHGFCDASEKAYAAVVYARTEVSNIIKITMLAAKTKVAPLKNKQTLPRLELSGAVLLAKLMAEVKDAIKCQPNVPTYYWTDSMITLAWIKGKNWKQFVSNRVKEINSVTQKDDWFHVGSKDNPADCASRGLTPSALKEFSLWWNGPTWLNCEKSTWPKNEIKIDTNEEKQVLAHVAQTSENTAEVFEKFSNYNRLVRTIAWCIRFAKNCKIAKQNRNKGFITVLERNLAEIAIIKIVQKNEFPDEIKAITTNKQCHRTSKLVSLNPFLDKDGILRVGGRLQNSLLSQNRKHPMLLPAKHHVTNLIIRDAHMKTLHGGSQLTLNILRTKFWIVNGKIRVQSEVQKCITCFRNKGKLAQQIMGNLPLRRVTPSPSFTYSGVDFAGPVQLRISKGRGTKSYKGYIAVFVCLVTKALHLEAVSDLSTDAFLAAYKRFTARRGHCLEMQSDNGTNFRGASNKMDLDLKKAIQQATNEAAKSVANDGTSWKFIPVASPHFGGIWEAGVKSVKGHLKRIIGDTLLTYEEFSTVLQRVEACLNSRPIMAMSSDPSSVEALTPGHFLIGRQLIATPEPCIPEKSVHTRWELVKKMYTDIWKVWSNEYLTSLQQRNKWTSDHRNIKIGELVLIKEDNMPVQKWALGRVSEVHSGTDGKTRVATVTTPGNTKRRLPIVKLAPLPITYDEEVKNNVVVTATIGKTRDTKNVIRVPDESPSRKRKPIEDKVHQPARVWMRKPASPEVTQLAQRFQQVPPRKKTKMRPVSALLVVAALATFSSSIHAFEVNNAADLVQMPNNSEFTIIAPKPGIYVEDLGQTQIYRGKIRIEFPFNISTMAKDEENAIQTIEAFKALCEETGTIASTDHCVTWLHTMQKKLYQIQNNLQILKSPLIERKKRGLFGQILQSIFGVNEAVYTSIDELEHNQELLVKKTNHQAMLMLSTVAEANANWTNHFNKFIEKFNQGLTVINEMRSWFTTIDANKINIHIMSARHDADQFLDELDHKYESLVAASLHERTIFDFIEFHQLTLIIEGLNKKLPTNIKVVNQPSDSISIEIDENQMKVFGYLNLRETNKFNLILATSVPYKIGNGKFTAISMDHQLLAVNYNTQEYFVLTTTELSDCITIKPMSYLCAPAAVYNIEDHENCIIDAVFQRKDEHTCPQKEFTVENLLWKRLAMQNTWMVVANKSTNGAITCNGVRKDIKIKDTLLIKINDECTIRTKGTMLRGERKASISVKSTFLKTVDPPVNTKITSETKAYAPIEPMLNVADSFFDVTEEPEMLSFNKIHLVKQHAISTTVTIILIIGLYIIWKTWINRCKGTKTLYQIKRASKFQTDIESHDIQSPQPQPRRVWPTAAGNQSTSIAGREHVQHCAEQG
jgi:Pao retrotransposon peptidase/Family of unknown function (DUF5641)/Integrase zinc binding domain